MDRSRAEGCGLIAGYRTSTMTSSKAGTHVVFTMVG
jgi:hypothetical protein